jgi:hypothetical protein
MNQIIRALGTFAFTALIAITAAHAQHHKCGVTLEEGKKIMEQFHFNRNEMRDFAFERGAVTYVPVRFYLVAEGDGTGRTSERAALGALCLLNENYANQEIQFYIKEFKYINNDDIYSDAINSGFNDIANQMIYNAINIFLTDGTGEEGVLGFYQPNAGPQGNDWVVLDENSATEKLVATHEVGHFFSLNHTFYGWECTGGWNGDLNGSPVGFTNPCGAITELVNMTNCEGSNCGGDCLCDTPADYMFGPSNTCSYTADALDPNGQPLSPDIKNFMNYIYGCSDYHFTDDQKQAIKNSLFSSSRNYIRPNYTPNLEQVTGTPTLVSPQGGELVPTYNAVPLEWTAVPGADSYLIEMTTSGQPTRRLIANSNTTVVNGLLPNKSYLWKVLGFNEYSTCAGFSGQKILKTGELINDTSVLTTKEKWTLGPNPVKLGESVFLTLITNAKLAADITIFTANGQLVQERRAIDFAQGDTSYEIETNSLNTGLYLVNIRTENATRTLKLSIVE